MRDAAIVDTNVLVYRYDYRFPQKEARATEVLQQGVERGYAIPHQALLEFVSVVSRPLPPNGERLLEWDAVVREAEDLMLQFDVLLPAGSAPPARFHITRPSWSLSSSSRSLARPG